MAKKQFTFDGLDQPCDAFGGSEFATKNPKTKRPLHSKFPLHLVLKGRKGGLLSPKVHIKINEVVVRMNRKYGHRMYDYSNNGNHIHASLKLSRIQNWSAYIRELTSKIVQILREAGLLAAQEKYWIGHPFTRIVRSWRKGFQDLRNYIQLNAFEVQYKVSRKDAISMREFEKTMFSG